MRLIGMDLWGLLSKNSERYVLAFHLYHANEHGAHKHTYQQIADKVGYTRRVVIEACKKLTELGLMTKSHERVNKRFSTPNTFWITDRCKAFLKGLNFESVRGALLGNLSHTPCRDNSDSSNPVSISHNTCTHHKETAASDGPSHQVCDALKSAHQANDETLHEARLDTPRPDQPKSPSDKHCGEAQLARQRAEAVSAPPIALEQRCFDRLVRLWPLYGDFRPPTTPREMVVSLEQYRKERIPSFNPWKWRQQVGRHGSKTFEALVEVLILMGDRKLPTDEPVEEIRNPAAYLGGILFKPPADVNPGLTLAKFDEGLARYHGRSITEFDPSTICNVGRPVIAELLTELDVEAVRSWFADSRYELSGRDFVIYGKSRFVEHWIKTHYSQHLEAAIAAAYGPTTRLKFGRDRHV